MSFKRAITSNKWHKPIPARIANIKSVKFLLSFLENAKEFLNFGNNNYFLIIVIEIKEIFMFKDLIKSLIKFFNNSSFRLLKELFNVTYYTTKSFENQGGDILNKREWLINYRCNKGFSQNQMAKQIGSTQQMYNYIESGKRRPSPELAQKIAKLLEFDWKLFYENKETKEE